MPQKFQQYHGLNRGLILSFLMMTSTASADFFNYEDFHVAVGAKATNQFQTRGMVTYGGHQVLPIFAIDVFNPNLQIIGNSLHYRHHISANFLVRGRLNFDAAQDEPLYVSSEREDERIRRETTHEADAFLEYRSSAHHYARFQISQDLKAHKGQYYELFGHFPLVGFLQKNGVEDFYQLGLFASVGAGNAQHNDYLYGNNAAGFLINNHEIGLMLSTPSVIDMFFPAIKLSHFSIEGDKNRRASYVQEKSDWQIEALFAFRLF